MVVTVRGLKVYFYADNQLCVSLAPLMKQVIVQSNVFCQNLI